MHHERKNIEMVKLPTDSASARAGMDRLCSTVQNHGRLFNASPKNLAYQLWRQSPEQRGRQVDCHVMLPSKNVLHS
jgi:hypothetical protein